MRLSKRGLAQSMPVVSSSNPSKGFTLIELLVVIAIIGLLATVVLASLATARAKGRDTRRLSDLKQIANVVAALSESATFAGGSCASDVAGGLAGCTTPAIAVFIDPTGVAACTSAPSATNECYRISNAATAAAVPSPTDWQVCAWLEQAAGSLTAGAVRVGSDTNYAVVNGACTH